MHPAILEIASKEGMLPAVLASLVERSHDVREDAFGM
jgi:hypothetical protein